jgi:hypothetical protein
VVTASSLSPGEEGVLQISFDGKSRSGDQTKTVRVTTNDPEQETVIVTIHAYVVTVLNLEPKVARMKDLEIGEDRVVRLKVRIKDPDIVSVTGISTSDPLISGRMVDDPETDGGKTLEVKVAAGRPVGKFQETLTLHTTSPSMPTLDVAVTGRVLGDVRLEPEAIGFQASRRPNAAVSPLTVMVSTAGQRVFHVTGLEDGTGYLTAELFEEQAGSSYRITVQLNQGGSDPVPESFNGVLRIFTDHPDQPVLELPVYRSGRKQAR